MDTAAGRILIVDDDHSLLTLMTAYLCRLGYEVVSCHSCEEAWGVFDAAPASYSLALVDINLPGMRGDELARRMLASNASIAVIAASGYPAELSGLESDGPKVSFLQKPFAPRELVRAIKTLLQPGS